jgi:WD40 repeat protein
MVNLSGTTGPGPLWSDQIGESLMGYGFGAEVSGDGRYIASGSDAGEIRFYNNRGDILWTTMAPSRIWDLEISRNGDYVAAATSNDLLLFDRSGNRIGNYSFNGTRSLFALSGDGQTIVVPGKAGVALIQSATGRVQEIPLNGSAGAVAISYDGRYIAAGTGDEIHLVDSHGNRLWSTFTQGRERYFRSISEIQISDDGGVVMAENTGELYSFTSMGEVRAVYSHEYHNARSAEIKLSDTGEFAVLYGSSKVTYLNKSGQPLWDHVANSAVKGLSRYGDASISGNGEYVAEVDESSLSVFDGSGHFLWLYHLPTPGRSVTISRNGKFIAVGTKEAIYFFNINGTRTMPEPAINETSLVPESVPVKTGTPTASSPVLIVLLALGVVGIIYNCSSKVR